MTARSDRRRRTVPWLVLVALVAAGGGVGLAAGSGSIETRTHQLTVRARQYAYDPAVIRVNRGDTLRLRLISDDVVHGFYLEGHDLDATIFPLEPKLELRRPSRPGEVEQVEEVVLVADREGKFRYRCSHTCGFMHPFMLGELIVGPNRLLPAGIGMTFGILAGGLAFVRLRAAGEPEPPRGADDVGRLGKRDQDRETTDD
ncbi:MAG: cupredoxin domain-containing protein [Planctomycetota bacterium]|jgi:plastocyanin